MYKVTLSYDGTRFFGWQRTLTGPSIQEELEAALFKITGEKISTEAASRTDRGVHALGQVVQFALPSPMDNSKLQRALNALLPPEIRIRHIELRQFHPTLDASGKEYRYKFSLAPVQTPMERLYAWHLHQPLDFDKMKRACPHLLGKRDFTPFANGEEDNPICTLFSIDILPTEIRIRGDRFLYKMVRNLVGTLVYIGLNKLPEDISYLTKRDEAGITAPAHGLYLHRVYY